MAFELIVKGEFKSNVIRPMEVSVGVGGFSFGSGFSGRFGKFVEVYLDRKGKRVGFKGTENHFKGFKLQKGKRSSYISTNSLRGMLSKGKYLAKIEDDIVVIQVPEIVDIDRTVKV